MLASSSSAVQTNLKNNTFLPLFICCSGMCSYLWEVFVADWNLLPLFPHSFVCEGIINVYHNGWTLSCTQSTVQRSITIKPKLSFTSFGDLGFLWLLRTPTRSWPRMTQQEFGIKFGCEKWDSGACSWLSRLIFPNVSIPVKKRPWTKCWNVQHPLSLDG